MSNFDLRARLTAHADVARSLGAHAAERLARDAVSEIERLNKALGEQTRMVTRWKNRTRHQREYRKAERERADRRVEAAEADVIELQGQLAGYQLQEQLRNES